MIGREQGIALNERDLTERHVELVGDDLGERGAYAGAKIHLAGIDGNPAVRADGEIAIDQVRRDRLRCARRCREANRGIKVNVTTSAPDAFSTDRRFSKAYMASSPSSPGGALHCADDS